MLESSGPSSPYIAASANVAQEVRIGRHVIIEDRVTVGPHSRLHAYSRIGDSSVIGEQVTIGRGVRVARAALVLTGARICPNHVLSVSSDGRSLHERVTVGEGVLLHDEVELGEGAMIPTQRTIAMIGSLGSKNRVVTIYGSDNGPRYSIGCQVGVRLGAVRDNVAANRYTTRESSSTYTPYLDVFDAIGAIVQKAYDGEARLVEELHAQRMSLGLDL